MAEIKFYANTYAAAAIEETTPDSTNPDHSKWIRHDKGSGIGFYGSAFGISVPVGEYNETTYVTNNLGDTEDTQLPNTRFPKPQTSEFANSGMYSFGAGTIRATSGIPNYHAPLNIRFTHTDKVRVQNCKLRIFDRSNIETHATDVLTKVYEVRHPYPIYSLNRGSGSLDRLNSGGETGHAWTEFSDLEDMADMKFTKSPGMSGLNTNSSDLLPTLADETRYNWKSNDDSHYSNRHDWYVALSASPDGIGSKTEYGLYFTLEYF